MKENRKIQKIAIPEEFHSFTMKGPFSTCINCQKFLLEDGTEYYIEKAIKKYPGFDAFDVIFEYAICLDCAENMRQRMSKESMKRIEFFFTENIDASDRLNIVKKNPENPGPWINKCLVKGTAKADLTEFQLYAHCNGKHLTLTHMPYLISGEVLDQIGQLLSAQTMGELDDFINGHFGPPPELEEEFPRRNVVLI